MHYLSNESLQRSCCFCVSLVFLFDNTKPLKITSTAFQKKRVPQPWINSHHRNYCFWCSSVYQFINTQPFKTDCYTTLAPNSYCESMHYLSNKSLQRSCCFCISLLFHFDNTKPFKTASPTFQRQLNKWLWICPSLLFAMLPFKELQVASVQCFLVPCCKNGNSVSGSLAKFLRAGVFLYLPQQRFSCTPKCKVRHS